MSVISSMIRLAIALEAFHTLGSPGMRTTALGTCKTFANLSRLAIACALLTPCMSLGLVDSANAQQIMTIVGTGATEVNGNQGIATEVNIQDPFGVEVGPDEALYVTEVGHHRVLRVDLVSGKLMTVAGNGSKGYAGDGGPATQAMLNEPYEVRFDAARNMYFVEMQNHLVRRVDADTGIISTIAGTGVAGFSGDGGPATRATFSQPHSIALDNQAGLYIADIGNHRIRRVDLQTGGIETIAGTGGKTLPTDGGLAKVTPMFGPRALAIRGRTMWIALREGNSVWKLDLDQGTLHHVAGSGEKGSSDGPANRASFNGPKGIVVDGHGNAFVVDTENHVIRKIDGVTRHVSTVVGNGRPDRDQLNRPHGICLGRDDSIIIGDTLNHVVRQWK